MAKTDQLRSDMFRSSRSVANSKLPKSGTSLPSTVYQRRAAAKAAFGTQSPPAVASFDYKQPGDSIGTAYDTDLQAADLVRAGLSSDAVLRLRLTSGLSLARIKQAVGISGRARSRRLSQEESERLLRVSRVFERATALFDGDPADARRWLETPLPVLGDRRPLDMAMTEPGARGVEDLIGRIGHGIVS